MTKHLEEVFNLEPEQPEIAVQNKSLMDMLSDDEMPDHIKDKIDAALGQIKGLTDDTEIDDLIKSAKESYKDLMDAGNNMDPRFSGKLFEVAASLLSHAITAQVHKNDRKLRVVDMQIKKQRLDMQKEAQNGGNSMPGQARVVDRNELLKQHKQPKSDK